MGQNSYFRLFEAIFGTFTYAKPKGRLFPLHIHHSCQRVGQHQRCLKNCIQKWYLKNKKKLLRSSQRSEHNTGNITGALLLIWLATSKKEEKETFNIIAMDSKEEIKNVLNPETKNHLAEKTCVYALKKKGALRQKWARNLQILFQMSPKIGRHVNQKDLLLDLWRLSTSFHHRRYSPLRQKKIILFPGGLRSAGGWCTGTRTTPGLLQPRTTRRAAALHWANVGMLSQGCTFMCPPKSTDWSRIAKNHNRSVCNGWTPNISLTTSGQFLTYKNYP